MFLNNKPSYLCAKMFHYLPEELMVDILRLISDKSQAMSYFRQGAPQAP